MPEEKFISCRSCHVPVSWALPSFQPEHVSEWYVDFFSDVVAHTTSTLLFFFFLNQLFRAQLKIMLSRKYAGMQLCHWAALKRGYEPTAMVAAVEGLLFHCSLQLACGPEIMSDVNGIYPTFRRKCIHVRMCSVTVLSGTLGLKHYSLPTVFDCRKPSGRAPKTAWCRNSIVDMK